MEEPQWKHHFVFEGTGSLACCMFTCPVLMPSVWMYVHAYVRTYVHELFLFIFLNR